MATPKEQRQRAGIGANVREIRATLKELEAVLPAALGWQWQRPDHPRPDANDEVRARQQSHADPTADVATDPDRLTLREAINHAEWETSLSAAALAEALHALKESMQPYGDVT